MLDGRCWMCLCEEMGMVVGFAFGMVEAAWWGNGAGVVGLRAKKRSNHPTGEVVGGGIWWWRWWAGV